MKKIKKGGEKMDTIIIYIGIFVMSCIIFAILKAGDN